MASFRAVKYGDIRLGEPLPFSVYDRSGILLLRAGFTIELPRQREILLRKGVYVVADGAAHPQGPAPAAASIDADAEAWQAFETMELLKLRLQQIFSQFRQRTADAESLSQLDELAQTIQETCVHDTDAALANLHLDFESSYSIVHHAYAAVLCELIGKKTGLDQATRRVLVKVALTHDLGLVDIQDHLEHQLEPLTPEQKVRVRAHPADGANLLAAVGVQEPVWLTAVRHHHERLDGSGYPDGLSGELMTLPMRVMAVADIYSAMVRDRPYRKALVSQEAMRSLLLDRGAKIDALLIQMLIKEVGVFPPGVIVKLADGQVAVVKDRGEKSLCPIVYAFVRADGVPLVRLQRHDTSTPGLGVAGTVSFADYRNSIGLIRELWHREPS